MAKQAKSNNSPKSFSSLLILSALTVGFGWWAWHSDYLANWKDRILQYIDNQELSTLEARYLPEKIIETHRQEIVGNDKKTIQNTIVKYYPYLLLDVKYTGNDQKTKEGFVLWGMEDGEIVLNTDTWEKTHGFQDCLECKANHTNFKILQALAKRQGRMTIDELQKELHIEREVLQNWIEATKENHLVVQKGNTIQLHFENPKLLAIPQTKMTQHIVAKPQGDGIKVPRQYSRSEIIAIAKEAFGSDFKIRSEQEVFLPVYALEVLNPDGSIQVSEWNSLTGQKITPRYLLKGSI